LTGIVQDTDDWAFSPLVARTPVGAPGTVDGTALAEGLEALPVPEMFVAVTVNV
jgi:hypothetical protein